MTKKHIEDFAADLGYYLVLAAAAGLVFSLAVVPLLNTINPAGTLKGWAKMLWPALVS